MKNEQIKPISTFPTSQRKIWLWGVILFLVIFIGIKEVSKLTEVSPNKTDKKHKVEKPKETSDLKIDESISKKLVFNDDAPVTLPVFPTGEKAFANYIQHNIHAEAGTKGNVIASFVVNKNGSLINVRILRSLNNEADEEVIRVLEKSPKWIPGKKNGKALNVMYSLPVHFDK